MPQGPYLPHIYYRDHIPMMKDLEALKSSGKATRRSGRSPPTQTAGGVLRLPIRPAQREKPDQHVRGSARIDAMREGARRVDEPKPAISA
jgi:hypothetical protein